MEKINGTKNGYHISEYSTQADWKQICERYESVKCVICNSATRKYFKIPLLGYDNITINNNIPDNVFYINGVF